MIGKIPIEPDKESRRPAIVVTGASSGIGRAIARVAARDGLAMVLVAKDELENIETELRNRGSEVVVVSVDLLCRTATEAVAEALARNGLYCDVLVNSAGFGVFGPAADVESQLQLELIDVNVRAVVALSLAFLPAMIARGRGGILNVGSITGYFTGPNMAVYFASKAFIRSFSAALAAEARPAGVTVTCLAPGPVRTAFFERCSVGDAPLMKIIPRTDAETVAKVAWRGFRSGKSVVVPRFADRLFLFVARALPSRLLTRFVAAMMRK
jgi:short-subunit dehydrogenase